MSMRIVVVVICLHAIQCPISPPTTSQTDSPQRFLEFRYLSVDLVYRRCQNIETQNGGDTVNFGTHFIKIAITDIL